MQHKTLDYKNRDDLLLALEHDECDAHCKQPCRIDREMHVAASDMLAADRDEIEQWKNAAKVMAALYGRNVKWDGGSWFRDNIEISLDEELPAESIEDLLQIAWKANKDGVTAALSQTTKDYDNAFEALGFPPDEAETLQSEAIKDIETEKD